MVSLSIKQREEDLLSVISNLQRITGFTLVVILLKGLSYCYSVFLEHQSTCHFPEIFFSCRLEVVLLLVIYLAYGFIETGVISYILLSISSWFMALSWLFAPYLFNPSGFEWQKYAFFILLLCFEF